MLRRYRRPIAVVMGALLLFNTVGVELVAAATLPSEFFNVSDVKVEVYANDGRLLSRVTGKHNSELLSSHLTQFTPAGETSLPTDSAWLAMRARIEKVGQRKGAKTDLSMTLQVLDAWVGPPEEFHDRIAALPVDRDYQNIPADGHGVARTLVTYSINGVVKIRYTRPSFGYLPVPEAQAVASAIDDSRSDERDGDAPFTMSDDLLAEVNSADEIDRRISRVPTDSAELQLMAEEALVTAAAMEYEMELAEVDFAVEDLAWDEYCEDHYPACEGSLPARFTDEGPVSYSGDVIDGFADPGWSSVASMVDRRCDNEKATRQTHENYFWGAIAAYVIIAVAVVVAPPVGAAAIAAAAGTLGTAATVAVVEAANTHVWQDVLEECRMSTA